MHHHHRVLQLAGIALAFMTLSAAPGDASAQDVTRYWQQNPAGICQSALPVYDGQIRKRPKAIQNEGTVPAFVTCSWNTQSDGMSPSGNPRYLFMMFSVNDGQPDHVSCVGVMGAQDQTYNTYTRGIDLHSNGGTRGLTWLPSDFGGSTTFPTALISVSCLLNPGVGINASEIEFTE